MFYKLNPAVRTGLFAAVALISAYSLPINYKSQATVEKPIATETWKMNAALLLIGVVGTGLGAWDVRKARRRQRANALTLGSGR